MSGEELVFVGKAGCHLCLERAQWVRAAARSRGLRVVELDASLDPQLEQRFGRRVPVLLHREQVLAELDFGPDELASALDRLIA